MAFSDAQIEDLRERADLLALLGRRVDLRKRGRDHVGLCPFHGERTPSFHVHPDRGFWKCFGCGEAGDVFKFFMKLDGLGFVEAVQRVAAESGVILVEETLDPEETRRRAHLDELAALMERAVKFYEQKLRTVAAAPAREHLASRGISEESIQRFRLGFGGAGRDDLSRALAKAGVSTPLAIEAGLVAEGSTSGRLYDRFRGRLIVPIRIPRPPDGRSVALGGRHLPAFDQPRDDYKPAKYINSPETPLYHKSRVLFGVDHARDAIRREERAVVVEGYFDVIGVHQAGLPLAVASCGTALTPAHLETLTRIGAKEVVFLFDGDDAGLAAAAKAAELCAKAQVPGRVATLPDGLDPDEFARRFGLEALQALLDRSRPAIEFLIDGALSALGVHASVEERVRAVQAVRPVVMAAPEGLARELYVGQIAERLGVSIDAVKASLAEAPAPRPRASAPRERERDRDRAPDASPDAPPAQGAREPTSRPRGEWRGREGRRFNRDEPPAERAFADFEADPPIAPPEPPAFLKKDGGRFFDRNRRGRDPVVVQEETVTPAVIAKRTFAAEEGITLALLKYPVLSATVAQEAVLGEFANAHLRALAEQVLAATQAGETVDAPVFLSGVADPALRAALLQKLGEDDANLEQSAEHLGRVVDRLRREVRKARALQLQHSPPPSDDGAARALLEEQQRILEESRAFHARIRERNRPKG